MTRKIWLTTSAFLLMLVAAIYLIAYNLSQSELQKTISIKGDGVTTDRIEVRQLLLHPGETQEYTVTFKSELEGEFAISLDYCETRDGGMKPYVNAVISSGDRVLFNGALETLLQKNRTVHFDAELNPKDPLTITLCYSMPENIGNEAQATFAEFDIIVTVERK